MHEHNNNNRKEDGFGFMRKNWQIIITIAGVIAAYSALSWSVKNHHEVDNTRDCKLITDVDRNSRDIAVLQKSMETLPRIEDKLDRIMLRLPRRQQGE